MPVVATKVVDLETYYGTYPKSSAAQLVKLNDPDSKVSLELLLRAYAVNLDESATEYDIIVGEWYHNMPFVGSLWLRDLEGEKRQELINRARKVGLPDDATEVEVVVAERKKARTFIASRDAARLTLATQLGLASTATYNDITIARIRLAHTGRVAVSKADLDKEVKAIEDAEAKRIAAIDKGAVLASHAPSSVNDMRESARKDDLLRRAKAIGFDGSYTEAQIVAEEKRR